MSRFVPSLHIIFFQGLLTAYHIYTNAHLEMDHGGPTEPIPVSLDGKVMLMMLMMMMMMSFRINVCQTPKITDVYRPNEKIRSTTPATTSNNNGSNRSSAARTCIETTIITRQRVFMSAMPLCALQMPLGSTKMYGIRAPLDASMQPRCWQDRYCSARWTWRPRGPHQVLD